MSSYSDSESPAANSIQGCIIQQQADKLVKMSTMGDLAQEQWEKDRRAREEDARHVMEAEEVARAVEARAARKAVKKAKRRARELESEEEDSPKRKKARVSSNDAGSSAALTGEANEGLEFPKTPCKWCVC